MEFSNLKDINLLKLYEIIICILYGIFILIYIIYLYIYKWKYSIKKIKFNNYTIVLKKNFN